MALAVLLGIRPLRSADLGYHLAYGREFLRTGRIVDYNAFIYTLPERLADRPAPGPGCWYDDAGRYRFPNANWGSQVIFALVYRLGGAIGLCVLQGGLIAAIFTLMLLAFRRLGVGWTIAAAGVLLAALTAHMRFTLRPEVLGYMLLIAQFYILTRRRMTLRAACWLIGLQVIFVNLHSYFLLGLALTGAFLAEHLLRLIFWKIHKTPPSQVAENMTATRRAGICLAVALIGQIIACLINPWAWRLAVLPIETIVYLRTNNIAVSVPGAGAHPWSYIGEFYRPFAGAFLASKATYAYCVVLGLGCLGILSAVWKRRWAWVFVIVVMAAISLSMRRNIAPAALLIVPVALAGLCGALDSPWGKLAAPLRWKISAVASVAVGAISLWFAIAVITQRFYLPERSPVRFGVGISALEVPLDAARWLREHPAKGRLWTDYNSSSSFHFFAGAPQVPILTNTWAYPPDVMREVMDRNAGRRSFGEAVNAYDISTVALRVDRSTIGLVGKLARDPDWALVHVDAMHVVFRLKAMLVNEAAGVAITEESFDVATHTEAIKRIDPVASVALHAGGLTLFRLGWDSSAAQLFAAAVDDDPHNAYAWNMRGVSLARLGTRRLVEGYDLKIQHMLDRGSNDLAEAKICFRNAIELLDDYGEARSHLALVEQQIAALNRGKILQFKFR